MDFACCSSFCESEVVEVLVNDRGVEGRFGEHDRQGGLALISQMQPKQEATSPKVRLRRVIRDFAHKVVGEGLQIHARSSVLSETADGPVSGLVRMDKGLSRLEIQTRTAVTLVIPLADIQWFRKGRSDSNDANKPPPLNVGEDPAKIGINDIEKDNDQNDVTLLVVQEGGPDLEMFFDSVNERDQAYICFKIFHMSVFSSIDSQSTEAKLNSTDEA